jgi:hypothetical protein
LKKLIGTEIKTEKGVGVIDRFYFTDLNILMVKIKYDKIWINYRIESLPELKNKLVSLLNNE